MPDKSATQPKPANPVDVLKDMPLSSGATLVGSYAQPTVALQRSPSPDLSTAEGLPYPTYADPFKGPVRRALERVPGIRSIIRDPGHETGSGDDSRSQVVFSDLGFLPYSAICRIFARYERENSWWMGSGFLSGSGVVVTAGHVVWHQDLGRAVEIKVWPGWSRDRNDPPIVAQFANCRVCANWPGAWRPEFDYGVILLDNDTTARYGQIEALSISTDYWNRVIAAQSRFLVIGYPGDKIDSGTQWSGPGRILAQQTQIIRHACDTEHGESGSPVLGMFQGRVMAIGIHSQGFDHDYNVARKIDDGFRRDFATWTGSGAVA